MTGEESTQYWLAMVYSLSMLHNGYPKTAA